MLYRPPLVEGAGMVGLSLHELHFAERRLAYRFAHTATVAAARRRPHVVSAAEVIPVVRLAQMRPRWLGARTCQAVPVDRR